jgi:hypothetical protein
MFGNFFRACCWLRLDFVLTLLNSCRLTWLAGSTHLCDGFALSLGDETHKIGVHLLFLLLSHDLIKPCFFLDILLVPERAFGHSPLLHFLINRLFVLPPDPILYGLSDLSHRRCSFPRGWHDSSRLVTLPGFFHSEPCLGVLLIIVIEK